MVHDDPNKQHDEDRERLLDEIRRRAEEAELRRIEDEDRSTGMSSERPQDDEASSPFPTLPPPFPSSPSYEVQKAQRGMVLRERLSIALDRRNLDNARELFAELELLDPFDPDLNEFRARLTQVEEMASEPESEVPPPVPEPPPSPPPPPPVFPPSQVEEDERTALYDDAVSLYEKEKYEQALAKLDRFLLMDSANEDALALHQQIERAWRLAELIKKEEERHRAENPTPVPVEAPKVPQSGKDSDFWGPTETKEGGDDAFIAAHSPTVAHPPKPPLLDQIVARISKIRIPVKPVLTVLGIVTVAVVGYLVVDAVVNAVVPPDRIICVFPPELTEGGAGDREWVDAFAGDLIRDLGSVPAIQVVAAQTSFATRQRSIRPIRMAQLFGAGHFLLWTAAIRGDTFSSTFTLMDTLQATAIWKSTVEYPIRELPQRRLELARNILRAMEVEIPRPDHPLTRTLSASSRAGYGSYLQGRAALQSGAPDAIGQAMRAFEHAVLEDSSDGDAWAALGWTYVLASESTPVPVRTRLPVALACVERALNLGAQKSEPFRAWGLVEMMSGNYAKAAERLHDAVNASPSDAEALRRLALVLTLRGLTDEALHAARTAVEVDPLNAASHVTAGLVRQFRGEFAEAEAAYRRALTEDREHPDALELHAEVLVYLQRADDALAGVSDIAARLRTDPAAYYRLGRIAQTAGRPKQEWMAAFERARGLLEEQLRVKPDSALALSLLALTETRLGAFRNAIAAQTKAITLAPRDIRIVYNTARMYALQRDKQAAMAYLSQAIDLRYDLRKIVDMDLFNLRTDAEFLRSVTR